MRRSRLLLAVLAATVVAGSAVGCTDGSEPDEANARGGLVEAHRVPAAQATALALDPDGPLLAGELETGRLVAIDWRRGSTTDRGRVETLDVRPTQRGLLGLAVTEQGAVLASLTDADGRIVVARVGDDGTLTTTWRGPRSADEANGGRLVVLPDGSVAIGIGDLLEPDRSPDPEAPNGKVLRLDGPESATPVAGGLNNPFAIAVGPEGTLWVADNAPGAQPERLLELPAEPVPEPDEAEDGAASDRDRVPEGRVVAAWDDTRVPSGLAWLDDGRLALCSYATSELRVVDADEVGELDDPEAGHLVADDCRYGVVALPDGGLAYAAEDDVVVLRPA